MNTVIVPAASDDLAICHPKQTVEVSVSPPDKNGNQTVIIEESY